MTLEELKSKIFIGVVEDNQDPKRLGRCKIRVFNVFEEIPTDDIPWATPWKDLNGNEFSVPDVGKMVTVVFDSGNPYKPEFIYAEHYNVNLQKKLQDIPDSDYTTFKTVLFDHSTQIYRSESEGLRLDHEYSNINLTPDGNININLRDNNSKSNIGSPDASQAAVLGTSFMAWMDKFVKELLGGGGGPYLGNLGAPVVASPGFVDVLLEYQKDRTPKFLSRHLWLVDNNEVKEQKRDYKKQYGDTWKSTVVTNNLTSVEGTPYTPEERPETGRPDLKDNSIPGDTFAGSLESDSKIQTVSVSNFENGRIPLDKMKLNKYLDKYLNGSSAYLISEASDALDLLMEAWNAAKFSGKQTLKFTDGYRSYDRQVACKQKYGDGAATPGKSNHGWGVAVDMYWGIPTSFRKNKTDRPSAYKHPNYKWFFENAPKFGWFNPKGLRDDSGLDEWWHWEYHGKKELAKIAAPRYEGPFEQIDLDNIRRVGNYKV